MKNTIIIEAESPDTISNDDWLEYIKFELGVIQSMSAENPLCYSELSDFIKNVKINAQAEGE